MIVRDTYAWGIVDRQQGFVLTQTVCLRRSDAIRKFNHKYKWIDGTYAQLRRKGKWIARRLFTEALR